MINIQFKKATMHNFLCFEHSEVILDSLGYTIVSGKNNRTIDNIVYLNVLNIKFLTVQVNHQFLML